MHLFLSFLAIAYVSATFPPYVRIFQANFTGPFGSTIKAYGNFELNSTVWAEDSGEFAQAQTAINNMMDYYNRSQFQRGPTYALEYYRDSSLRSIAYILYKTNGSVVTKYYLLRPQAGFSPGTSFYLGSQNTYSVRPGRQMPLFNYTTLPNNSPGIINTASKAIGRPLPAASVIELKYWSFPLGQLYLLREVNANSSSTYHLLLNTSGSMKYLDIAYVPRFVSSLPVDIFHVLTYLKRWTTNLYLFNIFTNQSLLCYVIYAQLYFDQLLADYVNLMVTLDTSFIKGFSKSTFSRTMGVVLNMNISPYRVTRTLKCKDSVLLDELNYSSPGDNPYHSKSYFNNDNFDERMGYNASTVEQYQQIMGALVNKPVVDQLYHIDYPKYRTWSIQMHWGPNYIHNFIACAINNRKNSYQSIWQTIILVNQTSSVSLSYKPAMQRRQNYIEEYFLATGTSRQYDQITRFESYCPLFNRFELGLLYMTFGSQFCFLRASFFRDTQNQETFYLGQANLPFKSTQQYINDRQLVCSVVPSCALATTTSLDATGIAQFFQLTQRILRDRNNSLYSLSDISSVVMSNLAGYGIRNVWAVIVNKAGVESTLLVTIDGTGSYILLGYTQPPTVSSGGNSNGADATQSNSSNNFPSIGGAKPNTTKNASVSTNTSANSSKNVSTNPTSPSYSLSGNGDLSLSTFQSLYPALEKLITQNSKGSCTSITFVNYYSDPLGKLIAFMLSCPELSGSTVYQIIFLTTNASYYFMGKQTLLIVPQNYWQLTTAKPSVLLANFLNSSIIATYAKGIELQNITFVNQLMFLTGELDIVGVQLNDGTILQGEVLNLGGSWVTLAMNVVQQGTGKPPANSNKNSSNNTNSSNITNNSANNSTQNRSSNLTSILNQFQLTFQSMSSADVSSDPYLTNLYQSIKPSLPQNLSIMTITQILRATFPNNSIVYQIYYSLSTQNSNSCYLTICFNPLNSQILLLKLTYMKKDSSVVTPSNPGGYVVPDPASYISRMTQTNSPSSFSSPRQLSYSQSQIQQKAISWAVRNHPQLTNHRLADVKIQISGYQAYCQMTFITLANKQYHSRLEINLRTNAITQISYEACAC